MKKLRKFLHEKLQKLLPTQYMDVSKVMLGSLACNFFRGVFKILIAGFLAPQAMGILCSIYSFFKIISTLADLGLDYATVTFVAAAIKKENMDEKNQILKTVLFLKILTISFLLVAGNIFAQKITILVFSDASLTIYIRLIFLAVGGQILWEYVSSYLSAHQEFSKVSYFLVTMPVLMLAFSITLILVDFFSLSACIMIYLLAPAITAIIWWPVLNREFMKYPLWDKVLASKILRFSRWIYLSNSASSTRNHLNPLLLKNSSLSGSIGAGEINAGLYSLGNDLANEITVFSRSLFTVLLPKVSGKISSVELRRFVKKSYKHLIFLIVPLALLIFAARPFISTLGYFKENYLAYLPSLNIFMILYCGSLFSIISIPMRTALYAMRLPQIETYLEISFAFILIGGGILLIPIYGCIGAAMLVCFQRVITSIVLIVYGFIKLQRFEPETN